MWNTKVVFFSLLLGLVWSQDCPTWTEWTNCCQPCTKSVNLIRSKKQLDCNGNMLQYRFDTCDQSWSDWSGCLEDGTEMRYRNACPDITETKVCKDKCGKIYLQNVGNVVFVVFSFQSALTIMNLYLFVDQMEKLTQMNVICY